MTVPPCEAGEATARRCARILARRGFTAAWTREHAEDVAFWLRVAGEMEAIEAAAAARSRFRLAASDTEEFPQDEWPYAVLAGRLAERIARGEFAGGRFPSAPEISRSYGVGLHVVAHARRVLMERGLIRTVPGRGTFTS